MRPIERKVDGRDDSEAKVIQGYCAAVRSALAGTVKTSYRGLNFSTNRGRSAEMVYKPKILKTYLLITGYSLVKWQ